MLSFDASVNYSPKFVITGDTNLTKNTQGMFKERGNIIFARTTPLKKVEQKNKPMLTDYSKMEPTDKKLGTIEDYFLWEDMTESQKRKIQHYQTLKYPKASEEGTAFQTLRGNPESINQYKRNYDGNRRRQQWNETHP